MEYRNKREERGIKGVHFAVFYFTLIILLSTYAFHFKEDFNKELLERVLPVVIVMSLLVILLCIIL